MRISAKSTIISDTTYSRDKHGRIATQAAGALSPTRAPGVSIERPCSLTAKLNPATVKMADLTKPHKIVMTAVNNSFTTRQLISASNVRSWAV